MAFEVGRTDWKLLVALLDEVLTPGDQFLLIGFSPELPSPKEFNCMGRLSAEERSNDGAPGRLLGEERVDLLGEVPERQTLTFEAFDLAILALDNSFREIDDLCGLDLVVFERLGELGDTDVLEPKLSLEIPDLVVEYRVLLAQNHKISAVLALLYNIRNDRFTRKFDDSPAKMYRFWILKCCCSGRHKFLQAKD